MVVILTLSATRSADIIRMWCSSLSYHPPGIIRFQSEVVRTSEPAG